MFDVFALELASYLSTTGGLGLAMIVTFFPPAESLNTYTGSILLNTIPHVKSPSMYRSDCNQTRRITTIPYAAKVYTFGSTTKRS